MALAANQREAFYRAARDKYGWGRKKNGRWGWRSEPLAHLQGLESRRCDVWQPGSGGAAR